MSAATDTRPSTTVHAWEECEAAPKSFSWRRKLASPVGRRHYVEIHADPGVIMVITPDGFVKRSATADGPPFKTTEEARAFLDRFYA